MPLTTLAVDGSGFTVPVWNNMVNAVENTNVNSLGNYVYFEMEINLVSGLYVLITTGSFQSRSYENTPADIPFTVPNNQTSFLWIDDDTYAITPTTTLAPPGGNVVCLGSVTALAGVITSISDYGRQELQYTLYQLGMDRLRITVSAIVDVKSRTPKNGEILTTTGYWAANDGGGATFIYSDTDMSVTNDGTVIRPNSVATDASPGRWLMLIDNNQVNVKQFGAICDGTKRNLTTTYNGVQRFAALANAQTLYGGTKGTWFELMDVNDTLDAVSIQAAIQWAMDNGCEVLLPKGQARTNRPTWVGKGEHGTAADATVKNYSQYGGFTLRGIGMKARNTGDGSQGSAIYLDSDVGNRYTLRCNIDTGGAPTSGGVTITCQFGSVQTTASILYSDNAAAIETKIEALTDIGAHATVTCPLGGASATLASGYTFVITLDRTIALAANKRSFHGEMVIAANTLNNSAFCRVYNDSGVVCFRGSAQLNHKACNMTLRGALVTDTGDSCYAVPFGLLHVHSSWQGLCFDEVTTDECKYIFGIMTNQGTNKTAFEAYGLFNQGGWSTYAGDLSACPNVISLNGLLTGPNEPADVTASNLQPWAVSADMARFTKRVQLPALASASGYLGSLNDKAIGETYWDTTVHAWLTWDGTAWIVTGDDVRWSADAGDANFAWVIGNERYILYNTALTANRTVSLSTTNVPKGKMVTIYRLATGIFTLVVNGANSTAANNQITFIFDGAAWKELNRVTIA